MEIFTGVLDFVPNLDVYLGEVIARYGTLSYAILFAVIFAETGFVLTPFLPGDSLLFAAGIFAAIGSFNVIFLPFLLWLAAFLGDSANYWVGRFLGKKIVANPRIPINEEHIEKTQKFYKKHGGKTIFFARFLPIVRTFAPFVAGMGRMNYRKFLYFSVTGGFAWVFGFTFLGYFFGNIKIIRENFSVAVVIIVVLSFFPMLIEFFKSRLEKKKNSAD